MSIPGCLVIQHPGDADSPGSWEIVVRDESDRLSESVPPIELAICTSLMIQTAGIKNPHVVLAPAANACFFVKLAPSEDVDARDRAALAYELEDHLPIDAESMVADFVAIESPSDIAGSFGSLAIPIHPWQGIVDAFESADLPVRSIVPSAVLAARTLSDGGNLAETVRWLLMDGPRCDCMCVRNETILSWDHLSIETVALRRQLLLDRSEVDRTVVIGANSEQLDVVRSIQPDVQFENASVDSFVREGARLLLDNRSQRWFDLRRDALGPSDPLRAIGKHLRWVGVAAALCFLALAIGGWWRSNRIENQIALVQAEQSELFREAFPGKTVPGAVLRRVRSEHTRVASSRGQNSDVEIAPSATMVLREILNALPTDVRFRIHDIDITDGVVDLTVLVKKSSDISTIVDAIQARGFKVPFPKFGRDEDDVSQWTAPINATWVGREQNSGVSG